MDIKMIMVPVGKIGKVAKINFQAGDRVKKNDELCIVEAGKGSRAIKASADAVVEKVLFADGDEAKTDDVIMVLQETAGNIENADEKTCDLLIIGGGPGGYVAAVYAAKKGKKVTLIEQGRLGGTCLNVGCIPTKALVKSAEVVNEIANAEKFGIIAALNRIDMKKVIEHKNSVVDRLVGGIEFLMEKNDIKVVKGTASFADDNTVYVDDKTLTFKNAIIATGSKITPVNITGIDSDCVLNSTTALSLDTLPKSVAIIGGGVIGMEFAFIYSHFGVSVTVIEFLDHLLGNVDNEASEFILNKAAAEGIDVHLNSRVTEIIGDKDGAAVGYVCGDKQDSVLCEKVLVAIGRQANLDALKLENTTIEIDPRKKAVKVDDHMRTSVGNIYAIGDATNIIQLAHVASHQGMTAVDNILGQEHRIEYNAIPSVIFTDPEVACVGYTAAQALKEGLSIKESRFDFQSNGKALTMEKGEGFIKLVKDTKKGKIIGATIVGADASALIAALTLAIANGLGEQDIIKTVFAHPTTAEVIHEAALGLDIGSLNE